MCLLIVFSVSLNGQEMKEGVNFPPYPLPENGYFKSGISLPVKLDNSKTRYFPPVFNQYGWSCNQASSIGYLLTYELARSRNAEANEPENQYPPLYAWNFLNTANTGNGVSYFDSWEIIKANGCPNVIDYPFQNDGTAWMSGYDKYFRAMKNRVLNNYSLAIGTPEGLQRLKEYLYNHFDGSRYGGVANFQIASGGMRFRILPTESANAGSPIIVGFGSIVGHAMTIVGYDDSVKLDFNGDGLFTNDLDINGDRIVDMSDWEKGALIVVNSWGKGWADNGKTYVAYSVLPKYGFEGGFWNRSVHLIDLAKDYAPRLTLKATLIHPFRNSIRIMAGVSTDPYADKPEHILEYPLFNYQGGPLPFGGSGAEPSVPFELGLDITPLLNYINPGEPVRFFLIIHDRSGYSLNGRVKEFSITDYSNDTLIITADQTDVPIKHSDSTFLSVMHSMEFKKVEVKEYPVEYVTIDNWYSLQLEAANLTSPFFWELDYGYKVVVSERPFPEIAGTPLGSGGNAQVFSHLSLPFSFPFYGEKYDDIIVNEDGSLFFESEFYEYPYVVDANLIFKIKKGIIPFGHDLLYYGSTNSILYQESDSLFTIFWTAMGVGGGTNQLFNVACYLYPDGKIEFHYGPLENDQELWVNYDAGLSRGDGRNYIVSPLATRYRYRSNALVTFTPYTFPDKIRIESGGLLFCRPEENNKNYDIHVRVQDKLNQVAFGVVHISTLDLAASELLDQNFPNPFISNTQIRFLVPEESQVSLILYDLSGRKVRTLVDEKLSKGQYQVNWNTRDDRNMDLIPGIYVGRLLVNDRDEKIKMLKIGKM